MEASIQTPKELIALAKQAVLNGDRGHARELASQALASDPDNLNAMLIMAGVSEPEASLNYLNRVLSIDPNNRVAREGMHWARQRLRKMSSAAWTPETAVSVRPGAVAPIHAEASSLKRRSAFATVLPWLLATAAIMGYGLWSTGLLNADSFAPGQKNVMTFISHLLKGKTAPMSDATQIAAPDTTPSQAVAVMPDASATFTATKASSPANTATLTPTDTATPTTTATSAATKTPVLPTATMGTPTQAYDPTSGLPIIQITPLVYLTEEPGPAEYAEPAYTDDSTGYVMEPVYREPLGEKWIDVNLSEQMLYAYEGDTIVGAFLVSTGLPDTPTVTGQYNVYVKLPSTRMTGPGYDLPNVPYTMYFYKGYGIHGTYWHSNFGSPMSHGCVNMETGEAGWLYDWAYVGILVNVHY